MYTSVGLESGYVDRILQIGFSFELNPDAMRCGVHIIKDG